MDLDSSYRRLARLGWLSWSLGKKNKDVGKTVQFKHKQLCCDCGRRAVSQISGHFITPRFMPASLERGDCNKRIN